MTDRAEPLDDLAKHLANANGCAWSSLMEECDISLDQALGTKPFWRRLARAAQEYFGPLASAALAKLAEVERLNAIIHGMQDGALVRDQAALIARLWAENDRLRAALRDIAVPLHDLAGNATLMREIARKALGEEAEG